MSSAPPPGFAQQDRARRAFRVLGCVVLAAALVLIVVGALDFFSAMNSFEGPSKFWMLFLGVPLLAVGAWLLQAGFLGAGARYASGEVSPVVKETAEYLTDGQGLTHLGVRDQPSADARADGPYCRSCGRRNDADDRFCGGCGAALA